eukprot:scaffold107258_cov63-Phaeocystis_antarctica.AAC.1
MRAAATRVARAARAAAAAARAARAERAAAATAAPGSRCSRLPVLAKSRLAFLRDPELVRDAVGVGVTQGGALGVARGGSVRLEIAVADCGEETQLRPIRVVAAFEDAFDAIAAAAEVFLEDGRGGQRELRRWWPRGPGWRGRNIDAPNGRSVVCFAPFGVGGVVIAHAHLAGPISEVRQVAVVSAVEFAAVEPIAVFDESRVRGVGVGRVDV